MKVNLPALNVELLSDLLVWVAQDDGVLPKVRLFDGWGSWVQEWWGINRDSEYAYTLDKNICGTAFCMAGQAAVQTGHNFIFDNDGTAEECYPVVFKGLDDKGKPKYKRAGSNISISEAGAKSLGLNSIEAGLLFDGHNTSSKIFYYAHAFATARGVKLNVPSEILNRAMDYGDMSEFRKEFAYFSFAIALELGFDTPYSDEAREAIEKWVKKYQKKIDKNL